MQKYLKKLAALAKQYLKIENSILLLLFLILAVNIIGAGFIYSFIKRINNELSGLNQQIITINNDRTELKNNFNHIQSLLVRMQAQFYRVGTQENEANK